MIKDKELHSATTTGLLAITALFPSMVAEVIVTASVPAFVTVAVSWLLLSNTAFVIDVCSVLSISSKLELVELESSLASGEK